MNTSRAAARWEIAVHRCSRPDTADLLKALKNLESRYSSPHDEDFVSSAPLLAHALPFPLREFLVCARVLERSPAYLVSVPELVENLGQTPPNWWSVRESAATQRAGMALVLMASLFGEVFAWSTQQNGRLIHDVVPISGHEHEQLGSGSLAPLSWHTEDAFHPHRGDYIALLCLRNPDRVPTTLVTVDQVALTQRARTCLSQKRFVILPDNSHLPMNNPNARRPGNSFAKIIDIARKPPEVAILFGSERRPYLRVDPDFTHALPNDSEAGAALDELFQELETSLQEIVLEPGDVLFVDNYRCAHGRRKFSPRYDGCDRWLMRVNISRDLRSARASGVCAEPRLMI